MHMLFWMMMYMVMMMSVFNTMFVGMMMVHITTTVLVCLRMTIHACTATTSSPCSSVCHVTLLTNCSILVVFRYEGGWVRGCVIVCQRFTGTLEQDAERKIEEKHVAYLTGNQEAAGSFYRLFN